MYRKRYKDTLEKYRRLFVYTRRAGVGRGYIVSNLGRRCHRGPVRLFLKLIYWVRSVTLKRPCELMGICCINLKQYSPHKQSWYFQYRYDLLHFLTV